MTTSKFSLRKCGLMIAFALFGAVGVSAQDTKSDPPASQPESAKKMEDQKVEYVLMETSMGEILLELNREKAPITVKNFLTYVEEKFYDGTVFHRVIPNFMIQGGGFTEKMAAKKGHDQIKNEWKNGLKNDRGTIAMARLGEPDTASSQFFINVKNNTGLDSARPTTGNAGYCVFGKVAVGMDVVDEIRQVKTTRVRQYSDVPIKPVVIEKARRITAEKAKEMIQESKEESATSQSGGG